MKVHRPYDLRDYDPTWKDRFLGLSKKILPILGDNLAEIEHIGSTSIEGMVAKPQIDVLVVVKNLDVVSDYYNAFISNGFTPHGRGYVAADDEYVSEDASDGRRLSSVHIIQEGNPKIAAYKAFRDYLQVNEKDRNLYIATKRNLYALHKDNYSAYDGGKKEVINAILDRAKEWALSR